MNNMRELKIHGIYKHFKGDYYLVEDIGIFSETKETCVIYRGLVPGQLRFLFRRRLCSCRRVLCIFYNAIYKKIKFF